jgi:hypothetical protein
MADTMQLIPVVYAPDPHMDKQLYWRQEGDSLNCYAHAPGVSDARILEFKWDGEAFTFFTTTGLPLTGLPVHLGDDGQLQINKSQ